MTDTTFFSSKNCPFAADNVSRSVLHGSVNMMYLDYTHYVNMSEQYTAIFHGCKNDNFQMIFLKYFSYFCSKHRLWVHVRTASVRRY